MKNTTLTEALISLSNYTSPHAPSPSRTLLHITIYTTLLLLIILISILGNLLVILAITSTNHLRQQLSNLFLINLATTDLTSASLVMSSSLVFTVLDEDQVDTFWCNFICAANYLCIIVSMLSLAFISIDRYVYITKPLTYHLSVTKTTVVSRCIYTWLQAIIFTSMPPSFGWVHYDYWEAICAVDWQNSNGKILYVSFAFIFCFFIPGCVIIYCYASIICTAQRSIQISHDIHPQGQDTNSTSQNNLNSHRKTVSSFMIVVCAFFTCMTPFCITKVIKVSLPQVGMIPPWFETVTSLCQYLACSLNPFIYAILREDFRLAFIKTTKKYGFMVCSFANKM